MMILIVKSNWKIGNFHPNYFSVSFSLLDFMKEYKWDSWKGKNLSVLLSSWCLEVHLQIDFYFVNHLLLQPKELRIEISLEMNLSNFLLNPALQYIFK